MAGKRVETVEVGLKDFEFLQSPGENNTCIKHNQQILSLVKKNKNLIRKRMTA